MFRYGFAKRGAALFAVLGVILIAIILANVVLNIISSQSRFTHHEVSRIQAYYAAMAGVNFALERLRTRVWVFNPPVNSCPNPTGCLVNEGAFPASIRSFDNSNNRQFRVIFCPTGTTCQSTTTPCNPPPGLNFCLNVTTNYTYTP